MNCVNPIYKFHEIEGRIHVPCGKCIFCRSKRRNDWSFRLYQEYTNSDSAYFITLTYGQEKLRYYRDEETGEIHPSVHKKDLQDFIKRLRYFQSKIEKSKQIRYYACGEYGEKTARPHYHLILFNLDLSLKEKILDIWNLGHVHIGICNVKTIAYTTKYVLKQTSKPKTFVQPTFSIMSKRPALGSSYLEKNSMYHKELKKYTVKNHDGNEQRLPRYYKDKIFSKGQKKAYAHKAKIESDKKSIEEDLRVLKLGNNPDKYILDKHKNIQRIINKNLNKEKL